MTLLVPLSRSWCTSYIQMTSIALLIFFVISKVTLIPSAVAAILALTWMLYVPFGMGNLITKFPNKFLEKGSSRLSEIGIPNILIKWMMGFILVTAIAFLLGYARADMVIVSSGLLVVTLVGNIIPYKVDRSVRITPTHVKILLLTLIIGISFAAYLRFNSPYPLTPGADTFTHLYVIKSAINNAVEDSPLLYAPAFDILIASASSTFNSDLVEVFWLGAFLLVPLFSLSLYALAYSIMRNHVSAFASTIIGLSMTEHGLVPNLQVFYPSSFLMSIFPIAFYVLKVVWEKKGVEIPFKILLSSSVAGGLILLHLQLGLMAITLFVIFYAGLKLARRYETIDLAIRVATIAIAVVLILYYDGYMTSQFELRLADGQYAYDTQLKTKHLNEWYTEVIMRSALFGMIAMALFRQRSVVLIGLISSILLLIYFQKIDLIHRYITLERPLLAIAAGILFTLPILFLTRHYIHWLIPKTVQQSSSPDRIISMSRKFSGYQKRISIASMIYLVALMILLVPVLTRPFDLYTKPYFEREIAFVNFTSEELKAARWIEQNTPPDYTIFSDPFTVIEMRGLAYRKNIEAIGWNSTVADLVKSSMNATNPEEAHSTITSKFGERNIIVVTPRTSEWLRGTDHSAQFPVEHFTSFIGFDNFFDQSYFTTVYESDNIFVFIPKPEHALSVNSSSK